MQIKILSGESLAGNLTNMGLQTEFKSFEISPSSILYHFSLSNPLDFTKVKKFAICLSSVIHQPIKTLSSSKASFCLSIPREERDFPTFKAFHNSLQNKPAGEILFGVGENGQPITKNIRDTKSILIGGSSGGGKSVCLNSIICSLICYSKPQECGLVLIDLKRCEFELFKNSSHLIAPVQFEYEGAYSTLVEVKNLIKTRYKAMQEQKIRKATVDKFPIVTVIIDEYAELASHSNKNQLDKIVSSIASTGRACNVFIIIATQHAVSTIISNTIKSNLQSRIGLRTTNIAQSSCILGVRDCVDLLGYGDSYISFDGVAGLQRVQGCYVDECDINIILEEQNKTPRIWQEIKRKSKFRAWLDKIFNPMVKPPRNAKFWHSSECGLSTSKLNLIDCVLDD